MEKSKLMFSVEFRYSDNTIIEGKSDELLFEGKIPFVPNSGDVVDIVRLISGPNHKSESAQGRELHNRILDNGPLYVAGREIEFNHESEGSVKILLLVDHLGN